MNKDRQETTFKMLEPGQGFYQSADSSSLFRKLPERKPGSIGCNACGSKEWEAENITARPWLVHFCPNLPVYTVVVKPWYQVEAERRKQHACK